MFLRRVFNRWDCKIFQTGLYIYSETEKRIKFLLRPSFFVIRVFLIWHIRVCWHCARIATTRKAARRETLSRRGEMKERPWVDQRDTSSSHSFRDVHAIASRVKMINFTIKRKLKYSHGAIVWTFRHNLYRYAFRHARNIAFLSLDSKIILAFNGIFTAMHLHLAKMHSCDCIFWHYLYHTLQGRLKPEFFFHENAMYSLYIL